MPVTRLFLVLVVLGGLALFALQNWSPVLPLVILGLQTQALPLAVWMVGAIAAGAVTTLIITVLFNLSAAIARRSGAAKRAAASQFSAGPRPSWTPGWAKPKEPSSAGPSTTYTGTYTGSTASRSNDDWNNTPSEDWADWGGVQEPTVGTSNAMPNNAMPNIETPVRDAEDEEWADWEGYEDFEPSPSPQTSEPPVDRTPEPDQTPPPPPPTYEIPQEPQITYQSGSLYSYSYRNRAESGVGQTESVYDAEYRVITPPQYPDDKLADDGLDEFDDQNSYPDEVVPDDRVEVPSGRESDYDDEDWGFEDEPLEDEPLEDENYSSDRRSVRNQDDDKKFDNDFDDDFGDDDDWTNPPARNQDW